MQPNPIILKDTTVNDHVTLNVIVVLKIDAAKVGTF